MNPNSHFSARRGLTLLELLIVIAIIALAAALIGPKLAALFAKTKTVAAGGTLVQTVALLTGSTKVPVNGAAPGMYLALLKANNAPAANRVTILTVIPMAPLRGTLTVTPANGATDAFGQIQFSVQSTNYEGPVLLLVTDPATKDAVPLSLLVTNN
jgi:prepilin-type N-terminal cleavage/methylation domain-containing protein